MKKLLTPITIGELKLPNRVIMAPLTRNRSDKEGIPNNLMKIYYTQRASAGLIISEGTNISPQAVGYIDTPGIWNSRQIEGWKKVTEAVHNSGGRIFMQLWHTGRSSHPDFHKGKPTVSASNINSGGRVRTYLGIKDKETPKALTLDEIKRTIDDYVQAAKNAITAGFDGVEAHGANGYLIDQFICSGSNNRDDTYGGSIEKRTRFALEVMEAICSAIGSKRSSIRLSPSGTFNGMYDETPVETFSFLVDKLNDYDLAYLHIMEPYAPPGKVYVPKENYLQDREVTPHFRKIYKGNLITNSGYTIDEAEKIIQNNTADMVAFGKLMLSNPDLVERIEKNEKLNDWDKDTFYTNGEKGYIDYPFIRDLKQ
ncbi:alkene reductase [bacterium]|nr:MAG: alkene reductase [bacterium]